MKTTLILSIVIFAAGALAATNTQTAHYFYDDAGRLAATYITRGATNMTELFTYDANGNRIGRRNHAPAPAQCDLDGDGLSDLWELVYFRHLGQTATGDPDGDGAPNRDEERAGTGPLDPDSVFQVTSLQFPVSGPIIRWSSVTGKLYGLARTTNLIAGFPIAFTNLPATPPLNVHTDRTATGTGPWVYRVDVK